MEIALHHFHSPLRYPGGKGKIANYLKAVILKNHLVGYDYVEPFAGGAGAALALLYEEYVSQIHINDLDRGVFLMWRAAIDEPHRFAETIETVEVNLDEWHRQRRIQNESSNDFEVGFSTFYLNRTNRSGIISARPIGGLQQDGPWDLGARFNRVDLARRVRRLGRYSNRITVTGIDAADVIRGYRNAKSTLMYVDPPYYNRGQELYRNVYERSDHVAIAKLLKSSKGPWIVSYDNVDEVADLYNGFESIKYSLSYSAARRYRGSELIFLGPKIVEPAIGSPARVSTDALGVLRFGTVG